MRAYIVVVYDEPNIAAFNSPYSQAICYASPMPEAREGTDYTMARGQLYFANRKAEAEQIAADLSKAQPGKYIIVGKSEFIFHAAVAEPTRSIMNEKGVFPE